MAGDYQSAQDRDESVSLDRTPEYPAPPKKGKTGGLGEFAASPAILALQAISNIEKGMQALAVSAPGVTPLLQQLAVILTQLRQAVPQALTGGSSQFTPSGILAPPSMAVGPPPGIGAQGGAMNAPTPVPMPQ